MSAIPRAEELVRFHLRSRSVPRLTPRILELAHALPAVAERWRVLQAPEQDALGKIIAEKWWPAVLMHQEWEDDTGWPLLAAGCVSAAEIVGVTLSEPEKNNWQWQRRLDSARAQLKRPLVTVLLRGAPPVRVLMAEVSAVAPRVNKGEWLSRCTDLLQSLWGPTAAVELALAQHAEGASQLAGLLIRVFVEMVWQQPSRPSWVERAIGATGDVDEHGVVHPVLSCVEKVRAFFAQHADGVCFVPAGNWSELEELRPRQSRTIMYGTHPEAGRLTESQWERLYPISSLSELLVRFRLPCDALPSTVLFAKLREQAAFVSDWRGKRLRADHLVELKLREPGKTRGRPIFPDADNWSLQRIAGLLASSHPAPSQQPIVLISGRAGSGKSMLLQRLHHELNGGQLPLHGPSVLLRVRELRDDDTWVSALARKLNLSLENVSAVFEDPTIAQRTILLLDGLDEAPAPARRRLLLSMQSWSGPLVVAGRQLREAEQWQAVRLELQDADQSAQRALLLLAGREDLADSLGSVLSVRTDLSPVDRAVQELAATPLGLSLLATLLKQENGMVESRVQLLRDGMSYLLDRAEAEGKISDLERRLFDGRGPRYLGAAAWKMLSSGRAVLRDDDLAWAGQHAQIGADVEVQLSRVLDSSGFVQRCSPEEREFSHKSFAEYCAAVYLQLEPVQLDLAWSKVGDAGIDEVLLHLSAIDQPNRLLKRLLQNPERPLSSLALATRMLVECNKSEFPGAKQSSLVASVFQRRLRILGRFPNWTLPGQLGKPGVLWSALRRWSDALRDSVPALVAACPSDVHAWLYDPPHPKRTNRDDDVESSQAGWPAESYSPRTVAPKLAEQLHEALRFPIPLRALLRMSHGPQLLEDLPRSALAEQLTGLCNDPDSVVRRAALDATATFAPLHRALNFLGRTQNNHIFQNRVQRREVVLHRVLQEGTPQQQKDALLRAGLAATKFDYYDHRDDESPHRTAYIEPEKYLIGSLEIAEPSDLAEHWRLCWATGLLGEKSDALLEELYALFLHDELPEARLRAVDALAHLWQQVQANRGPSTLVSDEKEGRRARPWARLHAEVRAKLSDPSLMVRIVAADYLRKTKTPCSLAELLPICLSADSRANLVGMAMALDAGVTVQQTMLLDALAVDHESWPGNPAHRWRRTATGREEPRQPSAETRWQARVTSIALESRRRIVEHLVHASSSPTRSRFVELLDDDRYASVARELLESAQSKDLRFSTTELRQRVEGAGAAKMPAGRRWVCTQLAARTDDRGVMDILRPLASDTDVEVAKIAREAVERADREAAWRRELEQSKLQPARGSRRVPVGELTLGVIHGFESGRPRQTGVSLPMAEPFPVESVASYTSFESLWSALRERPLELENWASVDYEGRDDRDGHIALLASKAHVANREKTTKVVARLRELYVSQSHRVLCLRDLDHPLVGLWAEFLLATSARERDLLALISRSSLCAERVARIAQGTELGHAAVDEFIAAVGRGSIETDPPKESQPDYLPRTQEPSWLSAFAALGGLEGLLRLLDAVPKEQLRRSVLTFVGQHQEKLTTNLSDTARTNSLAWARHAATAGLESDRVLALYLLAMLGDRHDATVWLGRLTTERPPVRVARAGLRLIRRYGALAEAAGLRTLLLDTDPELRGDVVSALAACGDASDVPTFFGLLAERTPREPAWSRPWSKDSWFWEERGQDIRVAALEGVIRHGDQRAALRLAKRLIRAANKAAAQDPYGNWRNEYVEEVETIEEDDEQRSVYRTRPTYSLAPAPIEPFAGLEDTALHIAGQHGHLPLHALLVVGALLLDPGDEEYGVNTEGYDEVMVKASEIPKKAAATLSAILERTNREDVRRAFLRCVLWGGPSSVIARRRLDQLGGVKRRDIRLILKHLTRYPTSHTGLALLASLGIAEKELVQIWHQHGII